MCELSLNIAMKVIYGPIGVWAQKTPHFWLIHFSMKCIRRKKVVKIMMKHYRNTSCLPLPLRIWQFDIHANETFTWLASINSGGGGGVINGADVIISAKCSWYWYILPLEIHNSPANYLTSNHKRFFERLKLLQKRQN